MQGQQVVAGQPRIVVQENGLELYFTDGPALQSYDAAGGSGALSDTLLTALDLLGDDLLTIRPGPVVWPATRGTCRLCIEFDLSDRAIELLAAAAL